MNTFDPSGRPVKAAPERNNEMTDQPDRVWLTEIDHTSEPSGYYWQGEVDGGVEYVRGDVAGRWQRMETAPKDGTVIFVWRSKKMYSHAKFDSNIRKAYWQNGDWVVDGVGGWAQPVLSGWMPLPPPPLAEQ